MVIQACHTDYYAAADPLLPPCLGPLYCSREAGYALEWGENPPKHPLLTQGNQVGSRMGGEDPPPKPPSLRLWSGTP